MTQPIKIFTGLVVLLLACPLLAQANTERCLDYWTVGESGCEPVPATSPTVPHQEPQVVSAPTLEQRVQRFMDDYDKPPREFVAFHLEPTLDNALAWVEKYNEMTERNVQLSRAWRQAQQIHGQAQAAGVAITSTFTPLPQVPDFRELAPAPLRDGITSATEASRLAEGDAVNPLRRTQPVVGGRVGALREEDKIEVRYYFNAESVHDQQFKPQLAQALRALGDVVSAVCIDVTPAGPNASYVADIPCTHRALLPGEATILNLQGTPTTLVNAPDGRSNRIIGPQPAAVLQQQILGQ